MEVKNKTSKSQVKILILFISIIGILMLVYFLKKPMQQVEQPVIHKQEKTGDVTMLPLNAIEREHLLIAANGVSGSINPLTAVLEGDKLAGQLICEPLIKLGTNMEPEAMLADSWEISEHGRVYTFYLKEDVKFSDGTDLTAEDVGKSIAAFCDESVDSEYSQWSNYLEGYHDYRNGYTDELSGIKIMQGSISFTFTRPHFSNIWTFLIPIQKADMFSNSKQGKLISYIDKAETKVIGTGPYRFESMKENSIVLTKNDNYRDANVKIRKIHINNINSTIVGEAFAAGLADLYSFTNPENILDETADIPSMNLYSYEGNITGYIGINTSNEILNSASVRQALAYGLDRQQIVKDVLGDDYFVPLSVYYDHSWIMPEQYNPYHYDKSRAEQILDEAGYVIGQDGVRQKNGNKMEFSLYVNEASIYTEVCDEIADNLKAIGVIIDVQPVDYKKFVQQVYEKQDYDLYFSYLNNGIEPPFHSIYLKGEGSNTENWRHDEAAGLLEGAEKSFSIEERRSLYQQWMTIYNSEIPQIPMNSMKHYTLATAKVRGIKPAGYSAPYEGVENYEFAE